MPCISVWYLQTNPNISSKDSQDEWSNCEMWFTLHLEFKAAEDFVTFLSFNLTLRLVPNCCTCWFTCLKTMIMAPIKKARSPATLHSSTNFWRLSSSPISDRSSLSGTLYFLSAFFPLAFFWVSFCYCLNWNNDVFYCMYFFKSFAFLTALSEIVLSAKVIALRALLGAFSLYFLTLSNLGVPVSAPEILMRGVEVPDTAGVSF